MKFTITFIAFLSISTAWGVKMSKHLEEPKEKRELGSVSYPTSGHSSHSFQSPALSQDDSNSISIGAGYSVGGAKPSFNYGGQLSAGYQFAPEGQAPSAHSTIQLAPISYQGGHGSLVGTDFSDLMNQISQGLNSGTLSLNGLYQANSPLQNNYAGSFSASDSQNGYSPELSVQQVEHGPQQYQQNQLPNQPLPSPPSYSAGTKGLGSYSSTGPVLFTPTESHSNQQNIMNLPSAGHAFSEAVSFMSLPGQSLTALTIPGPHSGPSQASLSFGNFYAPSHSSNAPYKGLHSGLLVSGKSSFKPSVYLGSGPSNSIHSVSSAFRGGPSFSIPHSGSNYGSLSIGSNAISPNFNFGGSSKFAAPSFLPAKAEGGSIESYPSVASLLPNGHFSSPPGTTYGIPVNGGHSSSSLGHAHSASSLRPKYYSALKSQGFGGSSSYKAPLVSQSSFSSLSSSPKFNSPISHFAPSKDIDGSYSDNVYTYNTIKYSEELKPKTP